MMARCDVLSVQGKSAAPLTHCFSLLDKLYFVDFAPIHSKTKGTYLLATYPRVTCIAIGQR